MSCVITIESWPSTRNPQKVKTGLGAGFLFPFGRRLMLRRRLQYLSQRILKWHTRNIV